MLSFVFNVFSFAGYIVLLYIMCCVVLEVAKTGVKVLIKD